MGGLCCEPWVNSWANHAVLCAVKLALLNREFNAASLMEEGLHLQHKPSEWLSCRCG